MYGLAALVGLVAGCGALLFELLTQTVTFAGLEAGADYVVPGAKGEERFFSDHDARTPLILGLLLVPAIGGFLSGLVTTRLAPEAAGHGTDAAIAAYHSGSGRVRGRVPFVKAIATALSLGTGGSGGREGPIAQIGAGFGSFLGRVLHLDARQQRVLLAAGVGAGVGSIFRAPLAGALFAAEVLYREAEVESDVVVPSFIASAVAYCTYSVWGPGFAPLFSLNTSNFVFDDVTEMLPYTVLAVALVPAVWAFIRVFYGVEKLSDRIRLPRAVIASIGGLLTGACGVALWQLTSDQRALSVLSHGYGILQDAFDLKIAGGAGAILLLSVAGLKIATTALTISTGGSGGVFGPSMVIGGGIGGAVGMLGYELGMIHHPGCFVLVGMCGFFAGAANTPISTIIMVSEMTGSYGLLLPSMWVCAITFIISSRWTIYREQVGNRAESRAHSGEYLVPLLEEMNVSEVFEPDRAVLTFPQTLKLSEIFVAITHSMQDYFPVLDDKGELVGMLSAYDIRSYTFQPEVHDFVIADDLVDPDTISVSPDDDLHTALEKFRIKDLDVLPVVATDNPRRLLGMLPRRAITRAYHLRLHELMAEKADD